MQDFIPKLWRQPEKESNSAERNLAVELSSHLQISNLTAKIMVNRGITSVVEGQEFLEADVTKLPSPFQLSGISRGVARLKQALKNKEAILVYGDYDVDGITGTALIFEMLQRLGAKVAYYIPQRLEEGYGLNLQAINKAKEQGVKLLITVDCGISSVVEIALANELGIDVIVTDHHEPPRELPPALAIINPKLDRGKVFDQLAGVGVAFKLAQAIHLTYQLPGYHQIVGGEYLDLVALGTVADMVPIIGENRPLVKAGLKFIEATWRPGLRALIEESGLWGRQLDTGNVGFGLAPKINAAGRISSPLAALELLLTEDQDRGTELAKQLAEENRKRQQVEQDIYLEAERLIAEIDLDTERVIVLASENWHAGVIGIVAAKIVEKYYRPTVLIALEQQEGKGSARSITGFDLYQALDKCKDLLAKFGGHQMAAGISIAAENISKFKQQINSYAQQILTEDDLVPVIKIDRQVSLAEVSVKLAEEMDLLAPFGYGNPKPVLACANASIINWARVGKEQNHLKVTVCQEDTSHDAIGFNLAQYHQLAAAAHSISLAFGVEKNFWQGQEQLRLTLKDLKPYFINEEKIHAAKGFKLIDARGVQSFPGYLRRFSGKQSLLYVYNYSQKQEIQQQLQGEAGQSCEFMIANYRFHQANQSFYEQIFLLELPLHFDDLSTLAQRTNKLHLCYHSIPNSQLLKHKFPDREIIGQVYLFLKGLLGQEKKKLTFRELFGLIYRQLQLAPEDGKVILNILAELKLLAIKLDDAGENFELFLLQQPEEKLDLHSSRTYNKLMNLKGSYLYWACFWRYAAKPEIQQAIFAEE
jgi:single-stranded-DNA-specific exonuclease RecJ